MQAIPFTYKTGKIYYRVSGTGSYVLLLHGFGEEGSIWNQTVAHLSEYFTCIVPDLPGSGNSSMIADMSIEGMADCMKALLDHEKNKRPSPVSNHCVIIGHSMGGYITLAIAEKHPSILAGIGLFHSTAYADNEEKKAIRQKAIEFIGSHGAAAFLKTSIPGLFSGRPGFKASDTIVQDLVAKGQLFSAASLTAYYRAMIERPDRTSILSNSTFPILFILGLHDQAIPYQKALEQTHLAPMSHVHVLSESGHMGMLEEAENSNTILQNFITSATQ